MWPRTFRTSKMTKDEHKQSALNKSFDVDNEYTDAMRTQSYVDFVAKAQLFFVTEVSSSTSSPCESCTIESILQPDRHLVTDALNALPFAKPLSDLLLDFFNTSGEASRICSQLLRSINDTHANYKFIQGALDRFVHYSPDQHDSAIIELGSFTIMSNPFDCPKPASFGLINDQYAAIMSGLNSRLKKVRRRIKLIRFAKKASAICLTVACSAVVLVGIGLAVHSISGLLLGPILFGLIRRRIRIRNCNTNCCKIKFLQKLYERLDVAAKGTYILNRDFDTISRLVARVRDEIEHMKEMIMYCLERKEDRFPLQEVVKGLGRRGWGFKKLVKDLEEHVCLCLVTINRARVLVMEEMSKP